MSRDFHSLDYRQLLSLAYIEYVSCQLSENGLAPSIAAIAERIGINEDDVSRILQGADTLDFRHITGHSESGTNATMDADESARGADLLAELHRIAAELRGILPEPYRQTERERAHLLDSALSQAERLKRLAWQPREAGQSPSLYRDIAASAFAALQEPGVPIVAAGIARLYDDRSELVTCNVGPDGTERVQKIDGFPLTSEIVKALRQVCEANPADQDPPCVVVTRPGLEADHDPERLWEKLTGHASGIIERKYFLRGERISNIGTTPTTLASDETLLIFFLFRFSYNPPESVARSIALLADATYRIHGTNGG